MSQWANTPVINANNTNGAISWVAMSLHQGSGTANQAANNRSLASLTPQTILTTDGPAVSGMEIQQVALTPNSVNTRAAGGRSSGWTIIRSYNGTVSGVTAVGGSGYTTGDTVTVSGANAISNGVLTITASAPNGNAVSAVLSGGSFTGNGGLTFTNKTVANASATGATFTVQYQVSGRAGRKTYETLAHVRSMANSGAIAAS